MINVDGKIMSESNFMDSKDLTVGGWLDMGGCTGITALPDGLTVGGSLYLGGCTGITALPDGLTVGGKIFR